MKIFLYLFLTLFIFDIVGLMTLKILGKITKTDMRSKILLLPLVGMTVMMGLSQLLNIILSAAVIAVIWECVIGLSIVYLIADFIRKSGRESFNVCLQAVMEQSQNAVKRHWMFGCVFFIGFSALALQMIKTNQLMSFQYSNNDIIFYLSTMDWLKSHSLMTPVQYTETQPYYLCAQYILTTTRFGSDILGSVLMQMLHLQAHQIFSYLGIVSAVLCGVGIYYLGIHVFKMPVKYSAVLSAIALISFSWKEMLILQYVPQMLGVTFLVMFITLLMEYFLFDDRMAKVLTSLFLVATATAYSEFSSYMFIIYVGIIAIQGIYTKKWKKCFQDAITIGLTGVAFNPLGFYIAVKFNLRILTMVGNSKDSIDAYGGRIKSFKNIIAKLFGGPDIDAFGYNLNIQRLYGMVLICIAACFALLFVYILWRKRSRLVMFIAWILAFFGGYELYFHGVRLAYGEYKHLVSISVLIIVILMYFIFSLERGHKIKMCFFVAAVLLVALNAENYKRTYTPNVVIQYDDTLTEIQEGMEQLPQGEVLGILGNAHYIQHQLIYAAKNTEVQLMGEGVNSYYTMLNIPLNNEIPDYILCYKNTGELDAVTDSKYEEVWSNERFMIVKPEIQWDSQNNEVQ